MLAYVFWHLPNEAENRDARLEYESALREFHAALALQAVPGLLGSFAYRVDSAPWLGESGYADWYLVDTSAALDALNQGAVTGPPGVPHAVVAARMRHGAGSLLHRVRGAGGACREFRWLAKPRGMAYADFYDVLAPLSLEPEASLWRRQMVLGPTAEFGLAGATDASLPAGWEVARTVSQQIWPEIEE